MDLPMRWPDLPRNRLAVTGDLQWWLTYRAITQVSE
jgi:hypothetical protein